MQLTQSMIEAWSIPELCDRFDHHTDEQVRLFSGRVRKSFEEMGEELAELEGELEEVSDSAEEA